jgi:DNA-binding FadR family transcriptional regulator
MPTRASGRGQWQGRKARTAIGPGSFHTGQGGRKSDQVFEQIAGCIRSGPADSRLATERELTTMFNTRRPTIREAIYRAELVGLVEVRRGAGTFVVGPKSRAPE